MAVVSDVVVVLTAVVDEAGVGRLWGRKAAADLPHAAPERSSANVTGAAMVRMMLTPTRSETCVVLR